MFQGVAEPSSPLVVAMPRPLTSAQVQNTYSRPTASTLSRTARGAIRRGSLTSSPSVVAASKPTKLSAAKTNPVVIPLKPLGEAPGFSGSRVRPSLPPWATMMIARSRTTITSTVNSTSAARREDRMPSKARKIISPAGTIPISHHGTLTSNSARNVDCR